MFRSVVTVPAYMTDRQTHDDSIYRARMSSCGNGYVWILMMLVWLLL